jgi:hypothetical protein
VFASSSPYKSIVKKLKSEGFESEYLDRLSARVDAEEEEHRLEAEIRAEVASALGRAGAKVDLAFLEMQVARRDVDAATTEAERWDAVERFNAMRAAAEQARLELRIHREAVGFRRNEDLSRMYPLPPKL